MDAIVFWGEKGERSEGCGLFWYCLRYAVNDDKMILPAAIVYDHSSQEIYLEYAIIQECLCNPAGGYIRWGLTPSLILICYSPPTEGESSHIWYKGDFFNIYIFGKWQFPFSLLLVKSEKIIFWRYIFRASRKLFDLFLLSLSQILLNSFLLEPIHRKKKYYHIPDAASERV